MGLGQCSSTSPHRVELLGALCGNLKSGRRALRPSNSDLQKSFQGRKGLLPMFPMCRAEQLGLARRCRRGLFESRSEARCVRFARSSSAAALAGQAAQVHLFKEEARHLGGLLLRTFLGRARKVRSRRATPGSEGKICEVSMLRPEKQTRAFKNSRFQNLSH